MGKEAFFFLFLKAINGLNLNPCVFCRGHMLEIGYKKNFNQRNAELLLDQTQKFRMSSNQVFLQLLAPTQKQWGACCVYQHKGFI